MAILETISKDILTKISVVLELYPRTLMGCLKVDGVFCTKKRSVGRLHNLRYIIMACIAFNMCIAEDHPCQPRWQLEVQDLP